MDKVLRQFLEVATAKNVTQAAKKLCMNQSTLSINIRRLEESLGVPLLIRSSSGVELTAFGQVVLEQARIMQRLHDNTRMRIEFLKERLERELKIGCGHAEWQLFVRQSIRTYRQRHPSANIHTELGNHLRLMDQLLSGDLDLTLGNEIHGLSRNAAVRYLPLYRIGNKIFVRQGHPLALRSWQAAELEEYPIVYLTPNENRYNHLMDEGYLKIQQGSGLQVSERTVYSSNSISNCEDILESTNAFLEFPGNMAAYFGERGIVALDHPEPQPPCSVGIYLLRERYEDPLIQDVLGLLRHYLAESRIQPA